MPLHRARRQEVESRMEACPVAGGDRAATGGGGMSLDPAKLEKVRELAGGIVQARCPACAEGGGDQKGEHLRIYPDGRYGCCVHPKDGEHRKRIFALVGLRKPGTFTLRLR